MLRKLTKYYPIHRLLFCVIHVTLLFSLIACNKLTEVEPPTTSLTSDNVYENDEAANSVLMGLYASLATTSPSRGQSVHSISLVTGLSADELILHGGAGNINANLAGFYLNRVNPGSSTVPVQSIWNDLYSKIYVTNIALERLSKANKLSQDVKRHLTGEAKFLRAFFYFYLVNLYGEVPLTISSDYRSNSQLTRKSKTEVYGQIVSDLSDAEQLLLENFVDANGKGVTAERTRPSKFAATALLARSYLYTGNWAMAEEKASVVINSSKLKLDTLSGVFLRNSNEAIWQLQPVVAGWNTQDARVFILPASGPTSSAVEGYPVYLSNGLLSKFLPGDLRKKVWVDSVVVNTPTGPASYYFPTKYKSATLNAPVTEYEMVLRLGEQYLIRAEARAQQNNISGAEVDLNMVRKRAGISQIALGDRLSALDAVSKERQVELFTEWGHRWLDLKRLNKVDEVMTVIAPLKGATWSANWQLYPIPFYDIAQNNNLVQNVGY